MHYDVIVLPIIEWDHRFQRPQHLSAAFARDGHRVLYSRLTFAGWDADVECEPVADNLWIVALPGPPEHNRFLAPLPEAAVEACVNAFETLRREMDIREAAIMVQQPFWTDVALRLQRRFGWKIVYDCMDEHDGLTVLNNDILKAERTLGSAADLVVTSSLKLAGKHEHHARGHLALPNACEFEHFAARDTRHPDPLPGMHGPIIGYYGAIMEWFDVDMVREAASLRPDWSFVLIGAIDIDVDALAGLPNVHLLGEKPYAELPPYLHRFDVAIIPFRIVPIIEATNPVKFYEYLSAGKPVVASDIPELRPFGHLYRLAHDGAGLVAAAEAAMRDDSPAAAGERAAWASRQTWEHRYQALEKAVGELWGKASVVIVSYQNLGRIRDCLESMARYTDYPDYEVVVVDNGSDAEVVSFLRQFAARDARFKLVEAESNLGFARANNVGIAHISPDSKYVVLLNNDTVVTQGWLGSLVQRLQDPAIGLVGPVTWPAGTANEAAIEVPYRGDDMGAMQAFASRIRRDNSGSSFDIPMLAFYCVAARRSLFDAVGPLDENFGIGMFEDDDYSIRVRNAGFRVVCARDVFIHHVGRSSFGKLEDAVYRNLFEKNRAYYEGKWGVAWRPPAARQAVPRLEQADAERSDESVLPKLLPGQKPAGTSSVSIVLVNYNGLDHLAPCLESLKRLEYPADRVEVILVDNASVDGSVAWLRTEWPEVRVIANDSNVGFSRACNQGVAAAKGEYVAFLNNDMRVDPRWLAELLEVASRDEAVACVGSLVMNWDGTEVEFSGRHDDPFSLSYEGESDAQPTHSSDTYSLFVSGGAMLIRKSDFIEAGGFDQRYFMYHEDVDLCWRLWVLGKRCCVATRSVVFHRGGASSAKLEGGVVLGWGQKHLLWTLLKNFDDANLRRSLPALLYFLVERGRWSTPCIASLSKVFEETQAALSSILHTRQSLQRRRRAPDSEIFDRLGHPLAFILRSPLFNSMGEELSRRHPSQDVDFADPAAVARALSSWLREAAALRSEYATHWREDARRKFRGHVVSAAAASTFSRLAPASEFGITSWGPMRAEAGEKLNPQPSGSSALWVKGSALEKVAAFAVAGGSHPCTRDGDTLTCELSQEATAALTNRGIYPLGLIGGDGSLAVIGDIYVGLAPPEPPRRGLVRRAASVILGKLR